MFGNCARSRRTNVACVKGGYPHRISGIGEVERGLTSNLQCNASTRDQMCQSTPSRFMPCECRACDLRYGG